MSLITKFSNSKIESVYTAVPSNAVKNDFFIDFFDEDQINKAIKMIGVQNRFWTDKTTSSLDLSVECAARMFSDLDVERDMIEAVIFITQTPDLQMPASSFFAHDKLGLKEECAVFDVNLGCSGYVYGLWMASSLINSGLKKVLLLAGETPSKIMDLSDPSTSFLFGDAGSATLLSQTETSFDSNFLINSRGSGASTITIPQGIKGNSLYDVETINDPSKLYMDGANVFNFTLKEIPKIIKEMEASLSIESSAWRYVLLHQANKFMLDHIYKKAKIEEKSRLINIEKFGNTSSVTLPLLLTDNDYEKSQNRILMIGFGVGLSWAAVDLVHDDDLKTCHFEYE